MSTIESIMTTPALTVSSDDLVAEAVQRMYGHRVGAVVVVDEQAPVGILTERDVLRLTADRPDLGDLRVGDAMTSPVDTVDAGLDTDAALAAMHDHGYRHLAVTGHGQLLGVVSLRDLAWAKSGPIVAPRGLKGVVVADSEVGDVRGNEGFYHYRQFSAIDLAEQRPLEDVWRLMIDGALPATVAERQAFIDEVRPLRHIPDDVRSVLPAIARCSSPLDGLRTALSLAGASYGMRPVLDLDPTARRADTLVVSALAPTLLTALHRLGSGLEPIEPRPDLGYAANYLWMLTGAEPSAEHARAVEHYLVSTVDHGFNASTFTGRVVASTGADVGACVVAAIGALSGPLHGGAPSRALELLHEIGTPERTGEVVQAKVRDGERIMGFGHAVYRGDDPRSLMLRRIATELGGPLVDLALEVEQRVVDVLAELKPGRGLQANVEYYAGVVMSVAGIPPTMFTPTFASSRVIGWCANVLEQAADSKIIRPSARYVGPPPPQPVPQVVG